MVGPPSVPIREAFKKKKKKCGFFPHGGGVLGQIHTFIKVREKGCFLVLFAHLAHFLPFLSAKFLEIFHTLGGGGSGRCGKYPQFFRCNSISRREPCQTVGHHF